jgi:hypothetical protein
MKSSTHIDTHYWCYMHFDDFSASNDNECNICIGFFHLLFISKSKFKGES